MLEPYVNTNNNFLTVQIDDFLFNIFNIILINYKEHTTYECCNFKYFLMLVITAKSDQVIM